MSLVQTSFLPADDGVDHTDALFEAFWRSYPRKVARPRAYKAFVSALRRVSPAEMGAGLKRWKAYWAERDEPQFIPHPTTWLNQDRWNDEPPMAKVANQGLAALRRCIIANGDGDHRFQ